MEAGGGTGDATGLGGKYGCLLTSTGMLCYKNAAGPDGLTPLGNEEESEFHGAVLANTREINRILSGPEQGNEDKERVL